MWIGGDGTGITNDSVNIIFDYGKHFLEEPILFESSISPTSSTMQIVDEKLKITCINTGGLAEYNSVVFNGGNKIDVTNYDLLIAVFDVYQPNQYGNCCMYIGDVKVSNGRSSDGIVSNRVENQGTKSGLVLAIDISALQGEKYINFCVQGYAAMSYVEIKKMFLI